MRVTHEINGVRLSGRKQSAVDFSHVPEHQRAMDARLANWAKWCGRDVASPSTSPMFILMPRLIRAEPGSPVATDADHEDAARIAKGVAALPEKHRQSLAWCYIKPCAPVHAVRRLGVTMRGLADLVVDARQMLINRGV